MEEAQVQLSKPLKAHSKPIGHQKQKSKKQSQLSQQADLTLALVHKTQQYLKEMDFLNAGMTTQNQSSELANSRCLFAFQNLLEDDQKEMLSASEIEAQMSTKADDLYMEFCRMVWGNLDQESL